MIQSNKHQAWQLVRLQCYIVIATVIVVFLWQGMLAGKSLLLGGLTAVLPTVYFAHRFFAKTGAQAAKQITRTFYRAEAVKLILTALLFVITIKCFSPQFLPFFIGFVVAQTAFWIGPFYLNRENERN